MKINEKALSDLIETVFRCEVLKQS